MQVVKRRTSHEVRGLKYLDPKDTPDSISRTSHEVRGLKSFIFSIPRKNFLVAPHTRCVD